MRVGVTYYIFRKIRTWLKITGIEESVFDHTLSMLEHDLSFANRWHSRCENACMQRQFSFNDCWCSLPWYIIQVPNYDPVDHVKPEG